MDKTELVEALKGRKTKEFSAHQTVLADAVSFTREMRGWLEALRAGIVDAKVDAFVTRPSGWDSKPVDMEKLVFTVPLGGPRALILTIEPVEVARTGQFRISGNLGAGEQFFVRNGANSWCLVHETGSVPETYAAMPAVNEAGFYDAVRNALLP